jgi:magnesium chelatase subunit I
VAYRLMGQAIRSMFVQYFPDPQSFKSTGKAAPKQKPKPNPYQAIIDWFGKGKELNLLSSDTDRVYIEKLYSVDGLYGAVKQYFPKADEAQSALLMEFLLHGLSEHSLISKKGVVTGGYAFSDILGSMLGMNFGSSAEDDEDEAAF